MNNHRSNTQSGFTLLELCVVTVIVGALMAGAIQAYTVYEKKRKADRMDFIMSEVEKYIENFPNMDPDPNNADDTETFGRLPCPAPVNGAAPATAGIEFNEEDCSMAESSAGVLVGKLPTKTLGIRGDFMKDVYGNYLVYAVSKDAATISVNQSGKIKVREFSVEKNPKSKKFGQVVEMDPHQNVQYVIFSAGENGAGALTYDGNPVVNCNKVKGRDKENCKYDNGTFAYSETVSDKGNNRDYDDHMAFETKVSSNALPEPPMCEQMDSFTSVGDCPDGWEEIGSMPSNTTVLRPIRNGPVYENVGYKLTTAAGNGPKYLNIDPATKEHYFTDFKTDHSVDVKNEGQGNPKVCAKSSKNDVQTRCFNKSLAVQEVVTSSYNPPKPLTYEEAKKHCPKGWEPIDIVNNSWIYTESGNHNYEQYPMHSIDVKCGK